MENKLFFKQSWMEARRVYQLHNIFRRLTKNATQVFVRGGDLIAINPQIIGIHEPVLTRLIQYFAYSGYGDFLLDIGANIGLTSCQNGKDFKQIHLFEPNPLCQKIAEVNLTSTLGTQTWILHPFGLGSADYQGKLVLPRANWGGGWIESPDQSYSKQTLLGKEGAVTYKTKDYIELEVQIKSTGPILADIFQSLSKNGLRTGVVKIDIEGMEPCVLDGIAKVLPRDMKVMIVFESFNEDLDLSNLLSSFQGRASAFMVDTVMPFPVNSSRIIKAIYLCFNRTICHRLVQFNAKIRQQNHQRDIVLEVLDK